MLSADRGQNPRHLVIPQLDNRPNRRPPIRPHVIQFLPSERTDIRHLENNSLDVAKTRGQTSEFIERSGQQEVRSLGGQVYKRSGQ